MTTHLPQLDVIELRVGMDVGVGNADELPSRGAVGGFDLDVGVQRFEHRNQRHIVLHTLKRFGVIGAPNMCYLCMAHCYPADS